MDPSWARMDPSQVLIHPPQARIQPSQARVHTHGVDKGLGAELDDDPHLVGALGDVVAIRVVRQDGAHVLGALVVGHHLRAVRRACVVVPARPP